MSNKIFTYEEVKKIHAIAAKIVAKHGDTYLPLFIRVHEELEKSRLQNDMKAIALKIASE